MSLLDPAESSKRSVSRTGLTAWIVASALILLAIGASIVWINRTRAGYNARSLSAAPHPPDSATGKAASQTKTLHVEGCEKDFLVKTGELVEPRAVPGASLDRFRAIYGKETKRDRSGVFTWDRDPYTLTDIDLGPGNLGNSVSIDVHQGHVVETLDGIELGIDSFGTIFRKMRDRQLEAHERMIQGQGNWKLIVSFYSDCGHKYRGEYSRTLPTSSETDKLIAPLAAQPNAQPGRQAAQATGLWRSDIFMNKVAFDYTLVPSNGQDDAVEGSPSEHH